MGLALDPDSLLNLDSLLPERERVFNASQAENDSTKTPRPEYDEDPKPVSAPTSPHYYRSR